MTGPAARFADPVELYDLCHQWVDHARHGARVAAFLRDLGVPVGGAVIEAACGTGLWLAALGPRWERGGFDLHASSLSRARTRVPHGTFWQADLADWAPAAPVEAVLCLFGALAYVPEAQLDAAAACLADALAPGGVALVEPWVRPDEFVAGQPQQVVVDTPWLKVCRQVLPRREGDQAVLAFHHLVSGPGLPPALVRSEDRLWLRDDARLAAALTHAGLREAGAIEGTMPGRQITAWRARSSADRVGSIG